jgi:hypothetical protein
MPNQIDRAISEVFLSNRPANAATLFVGPLGHGNTIHPFLTLANIFKVFTNYFEMV